jgi:hypothetical protein
MVEMWGSTSFLKNFGLAQGKDSAGHLLRGKFGFQQRLERLHV